MQLGGRQQVDPSHLDTGSDRGADRRRPAVDGNGSGPVATARRPLRRSTLPSGRALVGGLLVATAMVAAFLVAARASGGPSGRVVVADRDIAIGQRLDAGDLRVELVDLPDEVAGTTFADPATVVGLVAVAPLGPGEVVGRSAVADAADGHAFSFPVDRERAVNGHLQRGDLVDVLATTGTGESAATEVVAAGVRLLDLESAGSATLGSNGKVVVTLALADADQVLAAAHAAEVASITLVRSTGAADPPTTGGGDGGS